MFYDCDTQALSLDSNQLAYIYAFHGIGGLLSLSLHNNNLSFLGSDLFSDFDQLTTLLLQDNHLPRILPGTFDSLVSLTYIDLSRNRLKTETVPRAFLRASSKLRNVYLDDNQLKNVDGCMLATRRAPVTQRMLSLLGNPIKCDCSLRWLLHLR